MEDYLKQILRHLPIQFADEEANEFVKYLSEAYLENLEKEKYQFSFTAFHTLNMIFVYKTKWFLKEQGNQSIIDALNNQRKLFFNDLFDLSQISEKTSIEKLLLSLHFHANDVSICKNHVEVRNNCSHASGRIYLDTKLKVKNYIVEEIEFIEKIQKKLKNELKKFLQKFLEENWQKSFLSGDFKNLFEENYFSLEDLRFIKEVSLSLFCKKSDTEKIIKQKFLYLLLIFQIQNQIESEENLFLQKLSILIIDLPEIISVKKDGDDDVQNTNELIEEFIMPIISNFSNDDRKKAEEILELGGGS